MRIEVPKEVERFGAIRFNGLQKVFELDSGLKKNIREGFKTTVYQISYEEIDEIYKQMVVVVPVRSERLKLIEGVLCGIPHSCLIIIVSNSPLDPIDRFSMEKEALRDFCYFVNKNALIVHQKDPALVKAFQETGYTNILDKSGNIRDGKAEGMLIAKILAKLTGRKYIGFVDADNYFPGSVLEYIKEYAVGFCISKSNYSMVRIAWQSKPKIVESKLFFRKWGRTSHNTNQLLNNLISYYTGYETEIIKTGNAGEHALSMDLAMALDYSAGYSIEPYHYIDLIEKFGGITKSPIPEVMHTGVEVFQIESRNPHLHEAGDKEHIDQMSNVAMQVIYHSPVCPDKLKKEIYNDMIKKRFIDKSSTKEPDKPHTFPPLLTIDTKKFLKNIEKTPYGELIIGDKF